MWSQLTPFLSSLNFSLISIFLNNHAQYKKGGNKGANLPWRGGGGVPDGDRVKMEVPNGLGIEFLFRIAAGKGKEGGRAGLI